MNIVVSAHDQNGAVTLSHQPSHYHDMSAMVVVSWWSSSTISATVSAVGRKAKLYISTNEDPQMRLAQGFDERLESHYQSQQ